MEWNYDIRGYGLLEDFNELGLSKGWRLMEDDVVTDLHDLSALTFLCMLSFFDANNTMGLNSVSPLFAVPGFTIEALCLDLMHVYDLGITQHLIGTILRTLVVRNFADSKLKRAAGRRLENMVALRRNGVNQTSVFSALKRKVLSFVRPGVLCSPFGMNPFEHLLCTCSLVCSGCLNGR
ncbi:MAG: hypothetical protein K0U16_07915 [Gammaproteobacteria bacterium]|nr:hypothetical protein [Gammaproteobacteria bacterium]